MEANIKKALSKLLWENSNPTESFSSQTVDLSSSDYNYYEVIYLLVNNTQLTKSTGKIPKGKCAYLDYIGGSGSLIAFNRQVTNNADNLLSFNNAVRINTNETDNTRCIPLRIIGYK